ncbi:glycoside hydrolase family 3 C-terminal domain-containing protein [Actinoplanes sp. KI2]|uniref:glycoside hydrolase family 3 N-terminal domain-containing protein n=1 Tax=Actinoplanes sp. KI2 TaxID=2983315 RepID=UPI0021D5AD8A|nr:glycoside hydrolase family 3 N-terminal domain-containing protein [Actinoplanes sp. KI2]MCU7726088.1 glycoside hydrolase family 3 C-terminal domain-containing protein [Actinoplanes sp. KI2]
MRPLKKLLRPYAAGALAVALLPLTAFSGAPAVTKAPYLDSHLPIAKRVDDLIRRMTLDDKIGQMTQAERGAVTGDPSQITSLRLGSVLSGGGSVPTPNEPSAWVDMVNTFQSYALSTPLHIPMIYGIDAVHGHGNVYGATVFPHNVGMGATRDPALVEAAYRATASEVRATGIPWDFAPCVCVSRDERWGRAYESFSEDPQLVVRMETAIDGLRKGGVLATAKHYAGDGDTTYGTSVGDYKIDQGITITNRADFARIDLAPYVAAIRSHDLQSVMPSFSSVDWTEDGVGNPIKMHANQELISGVLKKKLGFEGFVISDWEGIHQIPDPSGDPAPSPLQVRTGVNAGIDMFMEPNTSPRFEQVLKAEVTAGRVSTARIDDAVRRILTTKFQLGLFEHPYASDAHVADVGSAAHRAVARQAVAESQVLLKNAGNVLPLRRDASIYVAGRNADNIGNQAGGWTIDWQGRSGDAIPGTTILQGIRQVAPHVTYSADGTAPANGASVAVVVVGETPYAEGFGDVGGPICTWCTPAQNEPKSLTLQPSDRAVVSRVCAAVPKCVVLLVSGRPQVVTDQLSSIDALVASWLPGSEGAGVADVLFGKRPFTGRLPVSWPASVDQVPINVGDRNYHPLYPFGWGLSTGGCSYRLGSGAAGLRLAAAALRGGSEAGRGAVLAAVRDAAQARVFAGHGGPDWQARLAAADQAQTAGDLQRAFTLYASVVTA